jgi:glycosyltransferase involved in cell wall biosynthesis
VEPVTGSAERRLRIAQVAPVGTAVRPGVGESVEQLVSLLSEELVRRGHQVTLFATGDSITSAELRSVYDRGYEHDEALWWDWQFGESMHVSAAYAEADAFDVIHCHSYPHALPLTPFVRTPNVQSYHVEMSPVVVNAYRRFEDVQLVVPSRFQARHFDGRPNVTLIPHGIDTSALPYGDGSGGYLLFLGRMIRDKGPARAVAIARAAGMPLVLAGPAEEHFDDEVAPLIDGEQVSYVGRVNPPERDRLLADAAALVYPLLHPEPFGLVVIEAMACGTPVVAPRIGAVPELVQHGVGGYLGESPDLLAALIPRALELDREQVRASAVDRFDFRRMVDDHENLYVRLAANVATARP